MQQVRFGGRGDIQLGRRLQTFSIVFPDAPAADESRFSRQMAGLLGTEHHEIEFRNSQIPDQFPAIVRHLEEPCSATPNARWPTEPSGSGRIWITGSRG